MNEKSKKLLDALKTISEECKSHEEAMACSLCAFGVGSGDCGLIKGDPAGWDILDEPVERLLK